MSRRNLYLGWRKSGQTRRERQQRRYRRTCRELQRLDDKLSRCHMNWLIRPVTKGTQAFTLYRHLSWLIRLLGCKET